MYVILKMGVRERLRLFILKIRANRAMKKMDYYIQKSHHYEDEMYRADNELVEFVHEMSVKYV